MFEDETVDITCPSCGHRNTIQVRAFEESAEAHIVCESCNAGVRIEAEEFRKRLAQVRKEFEELERKASRNARRKPRQPRKGDFQI
jgi:transcription elongation factor Elf1